jgi:hypothetical protein
MKPYVVSTGAIFALIALLHVVHAVNDWSRAAIDPGSYLFQAALGLLAAGLAAWACYLLRR